MHRAKPNIVYPVEVFRYRQIIRVDYVCRRKYSIEYSNDSDSRVSSAD